MDNLDLLFQGHATPEMRGNFNNWLWDAMTIQQTDLASLNSVYRSTQGRSWTSSKMDDLDLLFQGHVTLLMRENVTDWLWYTISHQQTDLASSNSVYKCLLGRSRTSSKTDDLDLLFQGHFTP